jgi:acyl carrier protein
MRRFLAIAVSVKSGMTILVKGDSLFFKGRPNYKVPTQTPIFGIAGQVTALSTRQMEAKKMQAFSADVGGRVLALVNSILKQNAITANVDPDSLLVDVGLTSMDMVNLMLGVEAEFDFTIPQSEITPENFQSVQTLQRMIVNQLEPAAAA